MNYECFWCGKQFYKYYTLEDHLYKKHPKEYEIYKNTREVKKSGKFILS